MNSSLYRSFLRVLEKWPLEPTKKGRDLGEHIRVQVALAFRVSEPQDTNKCEELCASLQRIANNKHKETFYISGSSSASGLSEPECKQIVSNEFLKMLEKDDGKMKNLKNKFFGKEESDSEVKK